MKFLRKAYELFKREYNKSIQIINYIVFGVLTTIVNYISYVMCAKLIEIDLVVSTFIAWFIAVIFAYITNRKYVFNSKITNKLEVLKEMISFFWFRIISGVIDIIIMYVSVTLLGINDLLMKVISNIIVIVLNYIFSKALIFNNSKKKQNVLGDFDNFDNMQKSPVIFFRYTIQMIMFLVAVYLVHLNFSIMNALWALVLLIVSEVVLEMIENRKYSKNSQKITVFKRVIWCLDRNFQHCILILSFGIRMFWIFKLNLEYDRIEACITILNCLCGSIITLFIYLISKELFSKRTGQILAIIYSIGIFTSTYCSVITNYYIFAVLILIAMYLLISKKCMAMNNIIKSCIIGLLLAISSIVRIEGIIYLVSFVVYLFANSLIKDNKKKEKYISIALILIVYLVVNLVTVGIAKITNTSYVGIFSLDTYKEVLDKSEKSVEQFELNQEEYWKNTDYNYLSSRRNINNFERFDSAVLLFCYINAAIFVIYCKIKNIEDERMYILYIMIIMNFFIYGFVKDNNEYSYVAKNIVYILAAGGLTIFKKNAELEAREKFGIKLIGD